MFYNYVTISVDDPVNVNYYNDNVYSGFYLYNLDILFLNLTIKLKGLELINSCVISHFTINLDF